MKRLPAATALVGWLLAACACGGPGQPGHTFELVEENGVPVAVNSGVPQFDGELFAYDKVVELREDPNVPESFLYEPRSFTLGDDGLYYVADNGNDRIAVFDGAGAYLHSIGRSGDGPGELRGPVVVDVRDGLVTVRSRKNTVFRTDGAYVEDLTAPAARPSATLYRAANGTLVATDVPQGAQDDGFYYISLRSQVLDDDGNVTATIEAGPVRWATGQDRIQLNYAGFPFTQLLPDNEIIATDGQDGVLSWYGLDGTLRRQVRIELPAEPVSEADKQLVLDRFDRLIEANMAHGAGEDYRSMVLTQRAKAAYPETKGVSERLFAEDSGWVWLRVPVPNIGIYFRGTPRIPQQQSARVVDPEGRYVGITEWPPEVNTAGVIVRGHLLGMVVDPETGETVPTAYRIRSLIPELVYP